MFITGAYRHNNTTFDTAYGRICLCDINLDGLIRPIVFYIYSSENACLLGLPPIEVKSYTIEIENLTQEQQEQLAKDTIKSHTEFSTWTDA